ncbi:hypothetical protein [Spongiimicrobium sp. 3-5]|uniref:hypothetical protein n=1 Tax=Spongiimicrobium sp. 3-5 TaxID=3332596 RepID=UPI003980A32E
MKYEILIEGGFTGIPTVYKGEIAMDENLEKRLLKVLEAQTNTSHDIKDGHLYHIKLFWQEHTYSAVFDEHNLPEIVREFIQERKR